MTQCFLTNVLPADLHIQDLFSGPFRAQRLEPRPDSVLPGYRRATIEASANGLTLGVSLLKKNPPTTRRGQKSSACAAPASARQAMPAGRESIRHRISL